MKGPLRLMTSALLVPYVLLAAAAPVAAANNQLYFGYTAGSILWSPTPNTPANITGLSLPAGKFWITITATLNGGIDEGTGSGRTLCLLSEDGNFTEDGAAFDLDANTNAESVKSLFLTALVDWDMPFVATLRCVSGGSTAINFEDVRISAVQGVTSGAGGPKLRGATTQARNIAGDSAFHTIATLPLTAGRWLVTGKSDFQNWPSTSAADVSCRLKFSASDRDQTSESLAPVNARGFEGEVAVQAAHSFGAPATARLQCRGNQPIVTDYNQLVAVKLGTLMRTPVGGSTATSGTGTPILDTTYKSASTPIAAGTWTPIATAVLPDGWWLVQAKATLNDTGDNHVECRFSISDISAHASSYGGFGTGHTGLYLQDAGPSSAGAPTIVLECTALNAGASVSNVRLTALSVSAITYQSMPT